MSLADHFVVVRADSGPSTGADEKACATYRSILDVTRFSEMLTGTYNDIDFGPFVGRHEISDDQLADHRWLRLAFLLAQFRSTGASHMEGLWWLDEPNESLNGLSPFHATEDDEAFARANALVFLTGGFPVKPRTAEAERYSDFCKSFDELPEALRIGRNSLLVKTLTALQKASGSLATARLMLTCALITERGNATLYRLAGEGDHATIDHVLRTTFGSAGLRPIL